MRSRAFAQPCRLFPAGTWPLGVTDRPEEVNRACPCGWPCVFRRCSERGRRPGHPGQTVGGSCRAVIEIVPTAALRLHPPFRLPGADSDSGPTGAADRLWASRSPRVRVQGARGSWPARGAAGRDRPGVLPEQGTPTSDRDWPRSRQIAGPRVIRGRHAPLSGGSGRGTVSEAGETGAPRQLVPAPRASSPTASLLGRPDQTGQPVAKGRRVNPRRVAMGQRGYGQPAVGRFRVMRRNRRWGKPDRTAAPE